MMKFFDQDGKLKRIELKQKIGPFFARLSRTSGLNASIRPFKGITLNTKHGLRLSKSFFGVSIGFRKTKNFFIQGRWSFLKGLINVNLSKSGISFSSKHRFFGTLNLSNPNRSSVKFLGIQLRGKKAAPIAAIGLFISLIGFGIKLLTVALYLIYLLVIFPFYCASFFVRLVIFIYSLVIFVFIDIPVQFMYQISLFKRKVDSHQKQIKDLMNEEISDNKQDNES